jgi:glycosyltransferase involved in cell wall biosynthesis
VADVELIRRLEDRFDAVIFLTLSDWRTEPRSNRYHYATRFARRLPVYFVQPDAPFDQLSEEPSGVPNIQLVHCVGDQPDDDAQASVFRRREPGAARPTSSARALAAYFRSKGVRRPLIWIYNFTYGDFIRSTPEAFTVYHATEDFSLGPEAGALVDDRFRAALSRGLPDCDLLVAVSETVRANAIRHFGFAGRAITLPNGCDFNFWFNSGAYDHRPTGFVERLKDRLTGRPSGGSVLYQGGINERLDYGLINDLAARMPDFTFDFCGLVDDSEAASEGMRRWREALARPNVRFYGLLSSEWVARLARRAVAAIAPYRDTPLIAVSLPLKAYEYLACGLPVVTLPIPALAHDRDSFAFARTAEDYEDAIRRLAPTRSDPQAVERRLNAARRMDYDRRFEELEEILVARADAKPDTRAVINVSEFGDEPPDDARVMRVWSAADLVCYEVWRNAGATITPEVSGMRIVTPARAWDYAAGLPLDFAGVNLATHDVRIEVDVSGAEGRPMLSVQIGDDHLLYEGVIETHASAATYGVMVSALTGDRLLFRNGGQDDASVVIFTSARLLAWPKRSKPSLVATPRP